MRVGVEQHCPSLVASTVDYELSRKDVPDLRETMVVLGMVSAWLQSEDSSIGLRRTLGTRMEQHLSGLARPPYCFPLKVINVSCFVGEMILARGLAGSCRRLVHLGSYEVVLGRR